MRGLPDKTAQTVEQKRTDGSHHIEPLGLFIMVAQNGPSAFDPIADVPLHLLGLAGLGQGRSRAQIA